MVSKGLQQFNDHLAPAQPRQRRFSILESSHPKSDLQPIDFILVYDPLKKETEEGKQKENGIDFLEARRTRYETYLKGQQGLVVERVLDKSGGVGFVKIHAPFKVLLSTAENIRMRLPIEKIEQPPDQSTLKVRSCWQKFMSSCKKPFYLDSSLTKNEPDYYTAVYSHNIKKFDELFKTLHGSEETYFTAGERSLLTYELLSRVYYNTKEDDISAQGVKRLAVQITDTSKQRPKWQGIDRLVGKEAYTGYFPLHEPLRNTVTDVDDQLLNDREKLKKHWATMRRCLKFQPLSLIRSYMGEKVAFYFALSGFYNQMLILPAIVGLIIFIYGAASVSTDQSVTDICGQYGNNTYMCPRCDKICPFWKLADSCFYTQMSYVFDNVGTLVFAIFMSLWARWFVEFWRRRQAVLQYDWVGSFFVRTIIFYVDVTWDKDSIDFEENLEPTRPDYESEAMRRGEERINPVTGAKEFYIPTAKRVPFFLIAAAVVVILILIVCATVFGTIVYRVQIDFLLKKTSARSYSSIIVTVTSAVINLICSLIFSLFYYWIARKLTNLEKHKYQSTYEDSMTIKIYLFQFVNFYSSLFYIAFFKGRFVEYPSTYGETGSNDFTEQCDPGGCLVELTIQLIIIMIGKQIINNLFEFIAAMWRTIGRACCKVDAGDQDDQWEKDNRLYDFTAEILMEEYLELIIQFGFVTLFVVAFPLAPLFALANNLIELRLDAWKLLSKYKRPIPYKASDIGIWDRILSAISHLAVLTNAVVIAWTSEFIPKMTYRATRTFGISLNGYVDWTLASFPIADYNRTGSMTSDVPFNLTYCRYRDFRESTGPSYAHTLTHWNVLAARLAFIVVFEHLVFFIIYLMQWLVPNVPKKIEEKIKHERFIDQMERWTTKDDKSDTDNLKNNTGPAAAALNRMIPSSVKDQMKKETTKPVIKTNEVFPRGKRKIMVASITNKQD